MIGRSVQLSEVQNGLEREKSVQECQTRCCLSEQKQAMKMVEFAFELNNKKRERVVLFKRKKEKCCFVDAGKKNRWAMYLPVCCCWLSNMWMNVCAFQTHNSIEIAKKWLVIDKHSVIPHPFSIVVLPCVLIVFECEEERSWRTSSTHFLVW